MNTGMYAYLGVSDPRVRRQNPGRERPAMLREERREQVLRSAIEVFAQKGYHATSIGDIIKRAAIARGTFYLYFENKRQIFEAILDMALQGLVSRLRRIELSPQSPPPLEQLRENVGRIIAFLLWERDLTQILLRHAEGLDVEFDRRLSAFYETIVEFIVDALRTGQTMGLVRPCHLQIVASCILGSIKEVVAKLTSATGDAPELDVVVDEIVNFGQRGIFCGGVLESIERSKAFQAEGAGELGRNGLTPGYED